MNEKMNTGGNMTDKRARYSDEETYLTAAVPGVFRVEATAVASGNGSEEEAYVVTHITGLWSVHLCRCYADRHAAERYATRQDRLYGRGTLAAIDAVLPGLASQEAADRYLDTLQATQGQSTGACRDPYAIYARALWSVFDAYDASGNIGEPGARDRTRGHVPSLRQIVAWVERTDATSAPTGYGWVAGGGLDDGHHPDDQRVQVSWKVGDESVTSGPRGETWHVIVEMPDGIRWAIPAVAIAHDRAMYMAETVAWEKSGTGLHAVRVRELAYGLAHPDVLLEYAESGSALWINLGSEARQVGGDDGMTDPDDERYDKWWTDAVKWLNHLQ